ncbi:MAG: alpha-L-fucosidase [Steroidobacteraceae bacterium]
MSGRITRKDFLRVAGLAALARGVTPAGAADPTTSHGHGRSSFSAQRTDVPLIRTLDPVKGLYPGEALERTGEVRFGPAEFGVMLPFFGNGEMTWSVTAPAAGAYRVAACYASTKPGTQIEVICGSSSIRHPAIFTEGFFLPYPGGPAANPGSPDKDSFWTERQFYSFERVPLSGELHLNCGVNVVRLRVTGPKGGEIFRLRSLELTPVAQTDAVATASHRARRRRANTDWFAKSGYGVWFHFLDLTTPRRGQKKPYAQAVNDLDVEALASLVADTGAAYAILTTNHGHPTCPAPIRSWEELHPGWTTKRDLIADFSGALNRRGMKLMLYMNCPGLGDLMQTSANAIDQAKYSEERYAEIMVNVFTEFGLRYGDRVAGYWLDSWFQTTETYPNLPFEALDRAVKAGYRDRMVAYNYWAFPIETEWQDYWCGELTDLPLKRFGSRYIQRGAGKGLQAHSAIRLDDPWFHITPNTDIQAPRYTAAELTEYIRTCMQDHAAVTFGVGIYQDGTISEASRQVLREVRRSIRGT